MTVTYLSGALGMTIFNPSRWTPIALKIWGRCF